MNEWKRRLTGAEAKLERLRRAILTEVAPFMEDCQHDPAMGARWRHLAAALEDRQEAAPLHGQRCVACGGYGPNPCVYCAKPAPQPQVFEGEAWTCLPCLKAMPEGGRTFRLILCKEQEEVLGCGGPGEDAVHVRYRLEVLK